MAELRQLKSGDEGCQIEVKKKEKKKRVYERRQHKNEKIQEILKSELKERSKKGICLENKSIDVEKESEGKTQIQNEIDLKQNVQKH